MYILILTIHSFLSFFMPILRRKYRYTDGVSTVLVDLPSFLIIFTILTQDPSSCGTVALVGLGKVCFSLSYLYDVLLA